MLKAHKNPWLQSWRLNTEASGLQPIQKSMQPIHKLMQACKISCSQVQISVAKIQFMQHVAKNSCSKKNLDMKIQKPMLPSKNLKQASTFESAEHT